MLDAWLDLVHGSRCVGCARPGRLLCSRCAGTLPRSGIPVRPTPCPPGLAPCRAAGEYAGLLRALVLAHKEQRAFGLARPLGTLLADVLDDILDVLRAGRPHRPAGARRSLVLLVPVPSRAAVVRQRGHDPMLRVAHRASPLLRARGHAVRTAPLLRQRLRVGDQAGLTAAQRADNLADSLAVPPAAQRAVARLGARLGASVVTVVCDDVLTTGATAREAQRALEDVGLPVGAVACLTATRRLHPAGRPAAGPAALPFSTDPD